MGIGVKGSLVSSNHSYENVKINYDLCNIIEFQYEKIIDLYTRMNHAAEEVLFDIMYEEV